MEHCFSFLCFCLMGRCSSTTSFASFSCTQYFEDTRHIKRNPLKVLQETLRIKPFKTSVVQFCLWEKVYDFLLTLLTPYYASHSPVPNWSDFMKSVGLIVKVTSSRNGLGSFMKQVGFCIKLCRLNISHISRRALPFVESV